MENLIAYLIGIALGFVTANFLFKKFKSKEPEVSAIYSFHIIKDENLNVDEALTPEEISNVVLFLSENSSYLNYSIDFINEQVTFEDSLKNQNLILTFAETLAAYYEIQKKFFYGK